MTVFGAILLVVTLLLYVATLGMITSMHSSDAAGNGLTQSFGFLTTAALWIFLGALLIVAGVKGELPPWQSAVALILVPASGAAALAAVKLLTDTFYKSKWPVVIPALTPLLLIAVALLAYSPGLRRLISSTHGAGLIWSAILILSLAPWPALAYRARHAEADRTKAETLRG